MKRPISLSEQIANCVVFSRLSLLDKEQLKWVLGRPAVSVIVPIDCSVVVKVRFIGKRKRMKTLLILSDALQDIGSEVKTTCEVLL